MTGSSPMIIIAPTDGYSTASVESEMSLSSLLGYCSCSHCCCHLIQLRGVTWWGNGSWMWRTGRHLPFMISQPWPIGEGQLVMDLSICDVVCPFQMVIPCRNHRGGGLCLFSQVAPSFSVSILDTKNVFVPVLTSSCNSGVSSTHPSSSLASGSLITFCNSFFAGT